uniref:Small ribosomal subunit protein uS3c n=1 Tax=Cytinus hypocistis TaxID=327100 RepID=A0A1B0VAG9_9ROSI|nr:ribosomal protein S3 [Cytinus hypocistis]AMR36145.1 ribosomal protein S3 [Cytinus hypocistis]
MGQKINPLGFRLGTTQKHNSIWFAQPIKYSDSLKEDKILRDYLNNYIKKIKIFKVSSNIERITRIEIKKTINFIHIIIYMIFPKLLINNDLFRLNELETNIKKELNCVNIKKIKIIIKKIENPYRSPHFIAEFIARQLKNRVSFRKALKKAIGLTNKADINGIQVQISGRLGGRAIAQLEWIREGRVPLQTIEAKIDYCSYKVITLYGILGIKIWIFFT